MTAEWFLYLLAGLLVPMGSLGDRIGRRCLLLIGASGFAAVSGAAAFAPSASWLVVARAAMGVFGSMLMPATLSSTTTQSTGAKPMVSAACRNRSGAGLPWRTMVALNMACSNSGSSPVAPSVICIFDTRAEVATQ